MIKLFDNKRSNILDIPLIGIMIFVAAIVFIIAFMTLSEINDGLIESEQFDNDSLSIIQDQVNIFPGIWDKGLVFALVALGMFTWVSAFFVRSHPVFFIFGFLVIVVYIFVFGIMSNTFGSLIAQPQIASFANQFTLTKFVMSKYPIIMAIISFITAIVTYSKGGEPRF